MNREVLLVDDDSIAHFVNTRLLEHIGLREGIHTAYNGAQALDLINNYYAGLKCLPEVILLDLNMPIMDGFAFIEAFYKLPIANKEQVSIVVVTSSDNPVDMERAYALGAKSYLVKPVAEENLAKVLAVTGLFSQ